MKTWIIEPRDPLIVRDGRPFGPNPGARAQTLPFPFPSTTAGGVRTRAGQDANGIFRAKPDDVRKIAIYGPLLVELGNGATVKEWLLSAPADALLLKTQSGSCVERRQLVPLTKPANTATNLADNLLPVGMLAYNPQKPFKDAPRYWNWNAYQEWLLQPGDDTISPTTLGHNGPETEQRMHVAITPDTFTSEEGALFQTRGLEFRRSTTQQLSTTRRLALAVATEATLRSGLAPLAGERRLTEWQPNSSNFPQLPSGLKQAVIDAEACRVILLTPAHFESGWHPHWLLQPQHGVTPVLKAVALRRYEVVSGWDFEKKEPKPTRRLAPSGTVFFLRLKGEQRSIGQWLDHIWMQNISDDHQDRLDGFGLAVVGTWSGNPVPMSRKAA